MKTREDWRLNQLGGMPRVSAPTAARRNRALYMGAVCLFAFLQNHYLPNLGASS